MKFKMLVNKDDVTKNYLSELYRRKHTYAGIINFFNWYIETSFHIFNLAGLSIQVKNNILGVVEDGLVNIVVIKQDKQLFIDKTFEKNYPVLYKRFKSVIEDYSNQKFDITYTDFCGRTMFLEYEKPKFSSIEERDGFINVLLEEMYQ